MFSTRASISLQNLRKKRGEVCSETTKAGNGRLMVQLLKEAWYNIVVQLRSSTWLMTSNSLELECNVTIMTIMGIEKNAQRIITESNILYIFEMARQHNRDALNNTKTKRIFASIYFVVKITKIIQSTREILWF